MRGDDRAVSIAVTHVLALGITAVLVSGLLLGAGTMLDSERERSTDDSLETIGERLAGEVASVDRAYENDTDNVSVVASHPRSAGTGSYTVTLYENVDGEDCGDLIQNQCLVLSSQTEDVEVAIPVKTETELADEMSTSGGTIVIGVDPDEDEIVIGDGS